MLQTPIHLRSALPGRERWQVIALKNNHQLAHQIHQLLSVDENIFNVVANATTGRVLVIFQPSHFAPGEIGQLIIDAVNKNNPDTSPLPNDDIAAAGIKGKFGHAINDNQLYEIIKQAQTDNQLRNKALQLSTTHSVFKLATPACLALIISSILFPIPALTNLGLSKGLQLTIFTGLFGASITAETMVNHKKNVAWSEYNNDIDKNLSRQVIEHVQALPMEYVDQQGSDKLMNLIKDDIATIKRFLSYTPAEFTDKAVTMGLSATILLAISPAAFALSLIPTPFITKLAKQQKQQTAELMQDTTAQAQTYNQLLSNNLSGLPTIKSFTAEQQEIEQLKAAKQQANLSKEALDKKNAHFGNRNELFFTSAVVAPLIYGCFNVVNNNISMTAFMIQNASAPGLITSVTGLEYGKSLYQEALAAATRLNNLLNTAPEQLIQVQSQAQNANLKPLDITQTEGNIRFDNISFAYANPHDQSAIQTKVLNDISFDIPAKGTVGFVGPTGSGKSTLMKILLRFYNADEGTITIDNTDINDLELKSLRQSIALVNQDPFLFEGTIYDNLIYGKPDASLDEVIAACKTAQAYDFIQAHPDKFDAQVGERGNKLSGGQRQRLSIARAVLKNSPILILDEATSAIDNETEAAIQKSIELIAKNATVIIIAHRLPTVRHADCIYHLKDGQISEFGSHEQLVANQGDYANLWRLQSAEQFKAKTDDGIRINKPDSNQDTSIPTRH